MKSEKIKIRNLNFQTHWEERIIDSLKKDSTEYFFKWSHIDPKLPTFLFLNPLRENIVFTTNKVPNV